jgi:hypothetical protein
MGLLYGRAGRLTAKNGGFRPGQCRAEAEPRRGPPPGSCPLDACHGGTNAPNKSLAAPARKQSIFSLQAKRSARGLTRLARLPQCFATVCAAFPAPADAKVGLGRIVALYYRSSNFIPDSLMYSVPPYLRRRCDRTLGRVAGRGHADRRAAARGRGRRAVAAGAGLHRALSAPLLPPPVRSTIYYCKRLLVPVLPY